MPNGLNEVERLASLDVAIIGENNNADVEHAAAINPSLSQTHSDIQPPWQSYDPLYQGRKMPLRQISCLEYFDEAVKKNPSAPALSMHGRTLNYAEVAFSVDALACWFIKDANMKPGDRVAIYLPNNLSYMICVFAAWRARLVVTNLSFMLQKNEILHQLQDSGSKLLITIPKFLSRVEKILLQTSIRHIVTTQADDYESLFGRIKNWLSPKKWLEQWREETSMIRYVRLRHIFKKYNNTYVEWPISHMNDIAFIQYTSGNSDIPKGVMLTHCNLTASHQQIAQILNDRLDSSKSGLCPIPLQHIVGVGFCLMMLSAGAHVVLTTLVELLSKPKNLERFASNILIATPAFYAEILKYDATVHLIKNIELFLSGGSVASLDLQQQLHKLTGRHLCEGFSLSETASLISINPPQRLHVGSAGVVLPNTEICIVGQKNQPLGFNQPGELWIRGPQVMRGYWQKPLLTQQAITHDGWLKSGDIVFISEDGFITMLERQRDVISWRGQTFFPQQIERQICEHEDVINCALIQEPATDPSQNLAQPMQGEIRLLVLAKKGLTLESLKQHIAKLYFAMIPHTIEFVDYLPRGPMGKVFRRVLRNSESLSAE